MCVVRYVCIVCLSKCTSVFSWKLGKAIFWIETKGAIAKKSSWYYLIEVVGKLQQFTNSGGGGKLFKQIVDDISFSHFHSNRVASLLQLLVIIGSSIRTSVNCISSSWEEWITMLNDDDRDDDDDGVNGGRKRGINSFRQFVFFSPSLVALLSLLSHFHPFPKGSICSISFEVIRLTWI